MKKIFGLIAGILFSILFATGAYGLENKNTDAAVLDSMSIETQIDFINQQIDEKNLDWVADETPISELSREEWLALLSYEPPTQHDKPNVKTLHSEGAPLASFDWRSKDGYNWISPIRDQGFCGSCWAFSAVALAESRAKIELNNPNYDIDLSEQDVVSCDSGSCSGGYHGDALNYMKNTGIVKESCFSYNASDLACSNKCSNWRNEKMKVSSYNNLAANVNSIKQAINDYGPVTVYMYADSDFASYSSGVYSHAVVTWTGGWHSIAIVGYNDANSYWICKNSWGTGWGETGYFRISYSENVLDFNAWWNDPNDNRTFFLDDSQVIINLDIDTKPTVNSLKANAEYVKSNTPINFSVYAKANSIKQLNSVNLNGAAMTGDLTNGGTFNLTKTASELGCSGIEGGCLFTVNATDDAGQQNTDNDIVVYIDDVAPRINLLSPLAAQSTNIISFDYNVSDNTHDPTVNCSLYLNGIYNTSMSATANVGKQTFGIFDLPDGGHNWQVSCIDPLGNTGGTVIQSFSVTDVTSPTILKTDPANNEKLNVGTTSTTITLSTDEQAICKYDNKDGDFANMTELDSTNDTTHKVKVSSLQNGQTYSYYFRCADLKDNTANSSYKLTFSVKKKTGGGGGGGGGLSIAETITLLPGESKDVTLQLGGGLLACNMTIETHTIRLSGLLDNAVELTISSTPQKVLLQVGETKQIDVNSDEEDDLKLTLLSKEGTAIKLRIESLLKAIVEEVTEGEQGEGKGEAVTTTTTAGKPKVSTGLATGSFIETIKPHKQGLTLIAVLVAVGLLTWACTGLLFRRKEEPKVDSVN